MKKITTFLFALATTFCFAQTTYDFQVERDATNMNLFTVNAIPSADATGADFTDAVVLLTISAGETIGNITPLTGSSWEPDIITADALTGANVGDGSRDVISLIAAAGQDVFDHTTGVAFPLVSFEVTSDPTSGNIEFPDVTDPLIAEIIGLGVDLGNVINIDSQDGFGNVNSYGALTGTTLFDFAPLSVEDFKLNGITAYPNPVNNTFNLKLANNIIDTAKIYNINGGLIKSLSNEDITNTVDISNLQTGVYFLNLKSGNAQKTIKILKL